MGRPQVADGGCDSKVWSTAGITLNKESSGAVKAWSPKMGFGTGTCNSPEGTSMQRNVKLRLENERTVSLERPEQMKMFMSFGI